MPTRHASAAWEGGLRGGKGTFEGESGAIQGRYSFGSRFEESGGSNPEELLAAADAACFSMALSGALEKQGHAPERVSTRAACTVEKVGDGFGITTMHLTVRARVPGIDEAAFQELARTVKDACPVSKALAGNVRIEVDAALE
jgi:lipoyl-dependent peroxiredoxin